MSNVNPKPWGRPRKRVLDPEKASQILDELKAEHRAQIEGAERRRRLAMEAADLGVTTLNIAEVIGSKQTTVSLWIRRAREEQASHDTSKPKNG